MEYLEFVFDHKTIRGFKDGTSRNDIVLFVHGFMGNKVDHHFMMRTFSDVVIQCGFSSYRFDFLGSGDSDGNFAKDESIGYQIEQLQYIIQSFQKMGYRVHVFAFSLGGVIATHCNGYESLFLLSPAGNFDEILDEFIYQGLPNLDGYEFNGFPISKELINEVRSYAFFNDLTIAPKIKIVQGTKDQYVSIESFKMYCNILGCESALIPEADHCFSKLSYTEQVVKEMLSFYGKIKLQS